MIKRVTITNHLDESLTLELTNPDSSGLIIKKIDGLGPVQANVNITELATDDGGIDNSARLQTRNIVMDLEFLQRPTIEDTRLLTYKFFPIKRNIVFTIETDRRYCEAIGRVESNEPDIFSENEGCQISILCADPFFYSAGDSGINRTIFYGTEPLFEFPFENPVGESLIEFGNIVKRTEGNVRYEGDAEVGVVMRIHAIGAATGLMIYNLDTREILRINDTKLIGIMGSGITKGDDIIISTIRGEKGIVMVRDGITTNILNALDRPISWFKLSKGDNMFGYAADTGLSNLQFLIENRVLYDGV